MTFLDNIRDKLSGSGAPSKHSIPPVSMSGGISSNGGHGMVLDDDMIVSKPAIVFHVSQIFFNFLAMACFASVAAFQSKHGVGPSGLSGFALFVTISGMALSAFMLLVPVVYEKYDKLARLARALKEVRVGFILTGTGLAFSLLIAFIVTISAWTQPGCKNAEDDPNAKNAGKSFVAGLPGWCNTKKAAAIFLWLAFGFWVASAILLFLDWRNGKLHAPRDPPFTRPVGEDEEYDAESTYEHVPPPRSSTYDNSNTASSPFSDSNRVGGGYLPPTNQPSFASPTTPAPGRPSMDAYGAFSDPVPSGYGSGGYTPSGAVPTIPEPDVGPQISRTMQYADPYAAIRATVASGQNQTTPPSYSAYR